MILLKQCVCFVLNHFNLNNLHFLTPFNGTLHAFVCAHYVLCSQQILYGKLLLVNRKVILVVELD